MSDTSVSRVLRKWAILIHLTVIQSREATAIVCSTVSKSEIGTKTRTPFVSWISMRVDGEAVWGTVTCQAIPSNHFHLVLRSLPDVVAAWDDSEVARRWLMLCPERRDKNGRPEEPSEFELNHIRKDKARLKIIRSRLSDISWWMRLLSQNIAQRANKEDGEIGKFWQARYRGVRLLDETDILACAAYLDLNPIRAALAETIEGSDFTSAQKRAAGLVARTG